MKLFAVNRYDSPNEKNRPQLNKKIEQNRLNELLAKAEKREKNLKKKKKAKVERYSVKKKETLKKALEEVKADSSLTTEKIDNKIEAKHSNTATAADLKEQQTAFTVIGKDHYKKNKEVKAPLPKWLANPTVIPTIANDVENSVYLSTVTKQNLKKNSIKQLFSVQCGVVPWLLEEYSKSLTGYWPRDICVSAPTGSGKTLAFVLPIVQILNTRSTCEVRALIVLPTQDLAHQVAQVFHLYSKGTKLKVVLAIGQSSLEKEQTQLIVEDICGFHSLADIVVTTPGRLVHHIRETKGFSLKNLLFLVVDEADRVMDGSQNNWLYYLDKHLASVNNYTAPHQPCQAPSLTIANLIKYQAPPQKLLFSATITHDPEKLAQFGLFQPKLFTCVSTADEKLGQNKQLIDEHLVTQLAMPAEIQEYTIMCENEGAKPLLLHCFIKNQGKNQKTLCFTSTKIAAHRLAMILSELSLRDTNDHLTIEEISSGLPLPVRDNILSKFSKGDINVIVCSDALARGIDIPDVDCVVSYDAPQVAQLYVHRVGRTGRAGRKGTAVTFLTPKQQGIFEHMLRSAGKLKVLESLQPPIQEMEALETIYCDALTAVKEKLMIEDSQKRDFSKSKKTQGKKSHFLQKSTLRRKRNQMQKYKIKKIRRTQPKSK